MGNINNYPHVTGDEKMATLQRAGLFKDFGPYDTCTAATQYEINASYDKLAASGELPGEEQAAPLETPPTSGGPEGWSGEPSTQTQGADTGSAASGDDAGGDEGVPADENGDDEDGEEA